MSGGATTVFDATANAFGHAAPNLSAAELVRHVQGNAIFSAPFSASRTSPFPGLGPMSRIARVRRAMSEMDAVGRRFPASRSRPCCSAPACRDAGRTAGPIPYRATERKSSSMPCRGSRPWSTRRCSTRIPTAHSPTARHFNFTSRTTRSVADTRQCRTTCSCHRASRPSTSGLACSRQFRRKRFAHW